MIARLVLALLLAAGASAAKEPLGIPAVENACRFGVIGDSGTGAAPQYKVGERMAEYRKALPYDLVIMLGDNIYGRDGDADMERKFEKPYKALLDDGVTFRATLGNHDDPAERDYPHFNMKGERYYTFTCSKDSVRFFAIDSNYMTPAQLAWLKDALESAKERWKIPYFHHPLYSTGFHGSDVELRKTLEPLFVEHGVKVVFSGHEHFYERIKPQRGITYFVSGGAGKLRKYDVGRDPKLVADGFDTGYHFMVVQIAGDDLFFDVVSDEGATVDAGTIKRGEPAVTTPPAER